MINRILLTGYIPGINGVSTHIHNIYRHLDRSRYDYLFLIPERYRDEQDALQALRKMGGDIAFLDYSKIEFTEGGKRQLKKLMLQTPDVCGVHAHDVNRNIYPLLLADSLELPVKVIQFHAGANKQILDCKDKNPAGREKMRLIKDDRFCRLASSDLSGRRAYGDLPFEVFPNAVDCERFAVNPLYRRLTREKLGIPQDAPVLGFAAELSNNKNPMFAAEVFVRVHGLRPEAHMIICGYGRLYNPLREFFKDKKLSEYVHLTGGQPQMEFFYNAMDVFLVPSFYEGLPNTVIEAQASGLPCLVSDRVSEMVCTTELVKRLSLTKVSSHWVDKVIHIIDEKKERRSYGPELKEAGYEIGDAAEKLMQIYDGQRYFKTRSSTS